MNRTIVTYETFHGSAKKIAEVISNKLNCKCILNYSKDSSL